MLDGSVNEIDAELVTKRCDEISSEAPAIIEEQSLRDRLILSHGSDDRSHDVDFIGISEESAIDVGARIIIQQHELISRLAASGEHDLLKEVSMPEAMRTLTLIELPDGFWRLGVLLLKNRSLYSLDGVNPTLLSPAAK